MSASPAVRDPALEARLARHFAGCCFGGSLRAFSQCASTMDEAHALAQQGAGEGMVVFAARQAQGRGRLGRTWESPEGGAYFSLILKPARPVADIPQLSLVAGLAAAETVRELVKRATEIRWPNDVLVDGRKIAGILVEAACSLPLASPPRLPAANGQSRPQLYVIVGIGINVATDLARLPDTATSLGALGVTGAEPGEVAAALCRRFDGWYDVWTAKGFAPIREALQPLLSHLGGVVRLTAGSDQVEGQAVDLDERGRLLVRLDSGVVRAFDVGEVTLLR